MGQILTPAIHAIRQVKHAEAVTKHPAARLVSTNLQRANGTWIRLCPAWYSTGLPAHWTSVEARRSGTWA